MKDFLFSCVFFGICIFICIVIDSIADYQRCKETSNALNYKYAWHYWTGCVIEKPDGSKALLRQMRNFEGNTND